MNNLFSDVWLPWLLMVQLLNFLLPLILVCVVLSFVGALISRKPSGTGGKGFRWDWAKLLSFSIVGSCLGIIIRQTGGLSNVFASEQSWSSLPAIGSTFVAIIGFFLSESQVEGTKQFKPIGTSFAILSFVVSYHYYSLMLGSAQLPV